MLNVKDTIISQYANSPILLSIIKSLNTAIDTRVDIKRFYNNIWDIDTANGYGLDIWGVILGINRFFKVIEQGDFIGFENGFNTFNNAIWYTGNNGVKMHKMDDESYRNILKLKAISNIIYATIPNINKFLSEMFKNRGRVYLEKVDTMHLCYIFEFSLTPIEVSILKSGNILPRPSGVLIDFKVIDKEAVNFGFIESELNTFDNGVFYLGI